MCLYPDIIVFSHLRWDFVYQRPQHLLSRLQAKRRIIFIEEPEFDPVCSPHWKRTMPEQNVLVCRPVTPIDAPGFHDDQLTCLNSLMEELLEDEAIADHLAWFYTPMALPLLKKLDPEVVIYDCMDELSAFLHAPKQLLQREAQLLKMADIVFTGGPSLYRAKKHRHANVHCFSSSVDAKHFHKACNGIAEPEDQATLPGPRLGFFGVIDERFDVGLLGKIAEAHPEWQLVMVGPIVKIAPENLPKYPNIHYTGQRNYNELPNYLKGWDVCLLPFALNDSTKFISPTKTLEYMAARKMIVSTMITDVAEPYGDIVYLGADAESFIKACENAINVGDDERAARLKQMEAVLANTSWDATVSRMEEIIINTTRERQKYARSMHSLRANIEPVYDGPDTAITFGKVQTLTGAAAFIPPVPVAGGMQTPMNGNPLAN